MKRLISKLIIITVVFISIMGCKEKEIAESEVQLENSNKLVVYSAGPKSLASSIEVAFENLTGIDVEVFQSTTGKILAKLEAEKDNPVADVVVLASWPSALYLKEQGMTQAYKKAVNADKLVKGFVDKDFHIFGYSASALGITYNTNLVTEPGKDWINYAEKKYENMINLPDPALSGSCMDFVSGYITDSGKDGWELFRRLKANGAAVTGANNEALAPVLTGSKMAVLAGVDYMAYSAKAKGEPVDIVYPSSGTVINPRSVSILKSSKNVINAKLFVDYMLSDDAQEFVKQAYILPGRKDILCDNRANYSEIPLLDYDWIKMTLSQSEYIEMFNSIFQ